MRYDTFRLLESMKARIFTWFLSCVTAAMMIPPVTLACAVCVPGVNDPVADAFNWSVLFLMVMPYLVVGSIAGGFFFAHRRGGEGEGAGTAPPVDHLGLEPK